MSTFTSTKSYEATSSFIPGAVAAVKSAFQKEGFDFEMKPGTYNTTVIEVSKGNLIKQALGLKLGLEISFVSDGGHVNVEARGVVFKNQLVASALTYFIAWPVAIPQIIGLIKQSKLDEKAISIVDTVYSTYKTEKPAYCTHCGGKITDNTTRCPHCGATL